LAFGGEMMDGLVAVVPFVYLPLALALQEAVTRALSPFARSTGQDEQEVLPDSGCGGDPVGEPAPAPKVRDRLALFAVALSLAVPVCFAALVGLYADHPWMGNVHAILGLLIFTRLFRWNSAVEIHRVISRGGGPDARSR
jgi:hypothetical protein